MSETRLFRNRFGQTNLLTTPVGLGLAALGRPGYINLGHATDLGQNYDVKAMENHAHAVLDAAWEAGIRYFDAARSYGKAEVFLSSWLKTRDIQVADVTVGSKWGYTYTADWQVKLPEGEKHEVKEHTLPVLLRQVQESRGLLGTHLDLYQIHSATLDSGVLENQAVLTELARLRDGGLAIGLSVSGPGQAETISRALDIEFDGRLLFSAVQATWNLLERSATATLQAAHEAGWGVIIKEALANGRLTERNNAPEFQAKRDRLESLALDLETSIDGLGLAAVLNQPFVDIVLSGAAQVDHLLSNLCAIEVEWRDSLARELEDLLEPPADYWQKRSQLAWN